ncbi:MAG TPA: nucleoside kinase [Oscillospiraceae bacterium]|nr:nucleoside kinase [Oscillospiraceae bacterium]
MTNFANNYVKYVNHLEQINEAAIKEPNDMVLQIEQAFHDNLSIIAEHISRDSTKYKVAMLSGPSSSGKTTTAHILMDLLKQRGVNAVIISLDDFYRGEANAPVLKNGQHDYESVDALNIPLLEQCLLDLMQKNECDMPIFDFEVRQPSPNTRHVQLKEHDIAIVEGIHALNPIISQHLPKEKLLKLYISVKQGIKDSNGEILSPSDIRLVRRLVRDHKFRGTTPERTINMWKTVMDGENKYIRPYKMTSDITINSILIYEPCVLRKDAISLLQAIADDNPNINKVKKLMHSLERFASIDSDLIPKNSIEREFIGGGIY